MESRIRRVIGGRFHRRAARHDELEARVMDVVRRFTDRKHLPDRRVSFSQTPVSFDVKTNVFVEDNSRNEYFRLWEEGELVFIVFRDGDGEKYGDGKLYADWIVNLKWRGPFPASERSTSGDDYYRISDGRPLFDFLETAATEVLEFQLDPVQLEMFEWHRG